MGSTAHVHASGDDTIKVGLVGCGGRGTGAASQALSTKGNVKLEAMADAFKDRMDSSLNNLQKQFSGRPERVDVAEDKMFVGFDAYQKLLDSGVDVVILATPPGFRPIHFEAAVNKGVHIFMEKPVLVTYRCEESLEAAKKAKEKNLVWRGLQRHHQAPYSKPFKFERWCDWRYHFHA
ncbi:probable oxidoreductase, partial [Gimesia maris DSM 8797]